MGVGGDSAVQSHSVSGLRGRAEGHTQEHTHTHTQERTGECCTYPLATYPLKSARHNKPVGHHVLWCGGQLPEQLEPDLATSEIC